MLKLLKAKWWKYLSIPLILFVFFVGILKPLAPGIMDIYPSIISPGRSNEVSISAYNSHIEQEEGSLQLWLRNGKNYFCGQTKGIDGQILSVQFDVPADIEFKQSFDLIINNDMDGTFELRDAFRLGKESDNEFIDQESCKVEVHTNDAAFTTFPNREILVESIRNLFFHVCMWFAMVLLLLFSTGCSIAFLNKQRMIYDEMAYQAVLVALLFGFLGIFTGMIWAKFTWGAFWPNDPKLNGVLVGLLAYLAYVILRGSIKDENKRGRLAAVYNIFAFVLYIIFIYVIPKFSSSLHPGMGGNPAFSKYDLDSSLRLVFYPAVIGWTLIAFWIFSIKLRIKLINYRLSYN